MKENSIEEDIKILEEMIEVGADGVVFHSILQHPSNVKCEIYREYTFEEYMKKYQIKSRSTVYNHEKEKKIRFFKEKNRTYIIPIESSENLDISDSNLNLLSSLEDLQNENLKILDELSKKNIEMELLSKDIKILNVQIEG